MSLRRAKCAVVAALALGACTHSAQEAPKPAENAAVRSEPSGLTAARSAVDAGTAPTVDALAADGEIDGPSQSIELTDGYRLEIRGKRITVLRGGAVQSEMALENPILTVHASPREPVIAVVTATYNEEEGRYRLVRDTGVRFVFLGDGYSKDLRIMDLNLDSYLGGSIWSPDGEYVAVTSGEVMQIVGTRKLKDYLEEKVEADFSPDARIGQNLDDGTFMEIAHLTGFLRWESPKTVRFSYGVCASWWTRKFDLGRGKVFGREECIEGYCLARELRQGYFIPDSIKIGKAVDLLTVKYDRSVKALVKKALPLWNRCVEKIELQQQIDKYEAGYRIGDAVIFLRVGDGNRVVGAHAELDLSEYGETTRVDSRSFSDRFQRCIEPEMLELTVDEPTESPPFIIKVGADLHEKTAKKSRERGAGGC